jgi:hypothetical protein
MAELDLSALWSWTIPLWGLFVLALFLGGVLLAPQVLEAIGPAAPAAAGVGGISSLVAIPGALSQGGGARSSKRVRWAPDV